MGRGVRTIALLALLAAGGGCSDPTPNEARLLLDRVGRLDPDDLESRRALVEALRTMPLTSEEVVAARDACVQMHEALLRAEDLSSEARAALAAAEGAPAPLGAAGREAIEAKIAGSQAAIERVRALEPTCHGRMDALRSRYAERGR